MSEYISRQAVLDLLATEKPQMLDADAVYMAVEDMPSLELVMCKDCKYLQSDKLFGGHYCDGRVVSPEHFCEHAERRET